MIERKFLFEGFVANYSDNLLQLQWDNEWLRTLKWTFFCLFWLDYLCMLTVVVRILLFLFLSNSYDLWEIFEYSILSYCCLFSHVGVSLEVLSLSLSPPAFLTYCLLHEKDLNEAHYPTSHYQKVALCWPQKINYYTCH